MCRISVWNFFSLLYWFAVISPVSASTCSPGEACLGNRPKTSGCCPSLPGGECWEGEGEGRVCDVELGYTCVQSSQGEEGGVCKGPFNLRASDVQYKSLILTWNFELPQNYSLEYTLFQTTQYSSNLSNWSKSQIGNEPQYVVGGLSTGTLYFLRIGVWEVPMRGIYRNLSETFMLSTKAGCEWNRTMIDVGKFRQATCEEKCECLSNGELECVPLCSGETEVDEESGRICSQVTTDEESEECCQRPECPPHDGHCMVSGTRYNNNTTEKRQCEICICRNGEFSCMTTAECLQPDHIACPRRIKIDPEPGQCCPTYQCLSDCVDGNVTYENGDHFHRDCEICDCEGDRGRLRCRSMCRGEPEPPEGCLNPVRHIPKGECCGVITCATPTTECTYGGESHQLNVPFTVDCQDCTCLNEEEVICVSKCSDLLPVFASPVCPNPQYLEAEDECCPLLWCHNPGNETSPNVVRSPKASSYELDSVTVEFRPPVNEGLKVYTLGYDVYYNDDVELGDPELWQNRFVALHELRTVYQGLNLTRSLSWLMNDTVIITISELSSNTTYFLSVRVRLDWNEAKGHFRPNVWRGTSGSASQPPVSIIPFSETIAARTLSKDHLSCVFENRTLRHGEKYREGCREECICEYRQMHCHRLCPEEHPVPSESCVRPVLENVTGECCSRWKCYPEIGGCFYGNGTLRNGEQIREGCDRYCSCKNGTMTCWPVCKHANPPRPQCERIVIKNRCCPTWKCQPERKLPVAMVTTLSFTLSGTCDDENPRFANDLTKSIITEFQDHLVCPSGSMREYIIMCESSQFTVVCPRFAVNTRPKRHTGSASITILVKIKAIINETVDSSLALHSLVQKVINVTSNNFAIRCSGSEIYPVISAAEVTEQSIICQSGYIRQEEGCVAGYIISSNQSISFHVTLATTSVTENTATLRWYGLPYEELDFLDELMLEYRDLTRDGEWIATYKLHSSVQNYVLHPLNPATLYVVRLILLISSFSVNRYTAASSVFQTHHLQVNIPQHIRPTITGMDVSIYSVTLRWDTLSENPKSFIDELFISYNQVSKDGLESNRKRTAGLSPAVTKYTLHELLPNTIYKLKVGVILSNGTTVFSLAADLRTKHVPATPSSSKLITHRGVIIGVSVVAILAVSALIMLIGCVLRRSRGSSRLSSSSSETNFENKMYDVEETDNAVWKK